MDETDRVLARLCRILEAEAEGRPFDAAEALRLARALMPSCPATAGTLNRMAARYSRLAGEPRAARPAA